MDFPLPRPRARTASQAGTCRQPNLPPISHVPESTSVLGSTVYRLLHRNLVCPSQSAPICSTIQHLPSLSTLRCPYPLFFTTYMTSLANPRRIRLFSSRLVPISNKNELLFIAPRNRRSELLRNSGARPLHPFSSELQPPVARRLSARHLYGYSACRPRQSLSVSVLCCAVPQVFYGRTATRERH